MMALKLVAALRALCLVATFLLATAYGAEQPSPLIGLTQDQVISRYGVPKSQVAVGGRVILFFAHERVVLRNGVVTEVETLPSETAQRPPPPAEPSTPAAPGTTATPPASEPAPATKADVAGTNNTPASRPASTVSPPAPSPSAEPQLSIKLVRAPGSPRPVLKEETPVVSPTPAVIAPKAPAVGGASTPFPSAPLTANAAKAQGAGTTPSKSTAAASDAQPVAVMASRSPSSTPAPTEATAPDKVDEPSSVPEEKKSKAKAARRRLDDADFPEPEESIFTLQTYGIAFLVIGAGAAFLFWRRGQRQLALDATAVSQSPFSPAPFVSGGTTLPPNLTGDLEWKRFEELVEAYYSKTGVVAARTKTGPDSPVHIKISWKGEPRPFAFVQCIAHPQGLIDVKPVQELFAALTAEDIRRGYVVTTGKFNIPARDFAEEKHITLMSGDIFTEKLNALPASARAELIQEFSVGDYTTPSCPKCEAKMERSAEDPAVWRCKAHPEVTIPAWK